MIEYSYVDNTNILLEPQKNAGLYSGDDDSFLYKEWGGRHLYYTPPNASDYCSHFYAKNHIPSLQTRPGNNSVESKFIKNDDDNYTVSCLSPF